MGNIGRPSSGCTRCRKRRVKCDERRPGCLRCEKVNEECPGYSQDAWVFRDENDVARRRALRLRRSYENAANTLVADSSALDASCTTARDQHCESTKQSSSRTDRPSDTSLAITSVQRSLDLDLELRSVCLFMETFTLDAGTEGMDPAYMDYLPRLYLASSPDSCLRKSVTAVAHSTFVNRYGAHDLMPVTFQAYGRALAATTKALNNPSTILADSTLAAVSLLSLYELLCRPTLPMKAGTGWISHTEGVVQLLQIRGKKQFDSPLGRQIYRMNWLPVMVKYIMLYQEIPKRFVELAKIMGAIQCEEVAGVILMSDFFYDSSRIRSELQKFIQRRDLDPKGLTSQIQSLVDKAEAIMAWNCFEDWAIHDDHWKPRDRPNSGATDKMFFTSIYVLSHWLLYWGTKMSIHATIIHSLLATSKYSTEDITDRVMSLRAQIEETADILLGTVDFGLNKFDSRGETIKFWQPESQRISSVGGLQLFWPLGVIKHSPYTTTSQKQIASKALREIGTDYLVAQALIHI